MAYAIFLIETGCLGLLDIKYETNLYPGEWEEKLSMLRDDYNLREADYPEVHNFILTAVDFTEEAGLPMPALWEDVQNMLEEDTDDIPMVDFEFGVDGRHVLYSAADLPSEETFGILRNTLGDKFVNLSVIKEHGCYSNWVEREKMRHPTLEYVEPEEFPEPPSKDSLQNPDMIAMLASEEDIPSENLVDEVISLTGRGIVNDLSVAIMNEIKETRHCYDEIDYRPLLFNCTFCLMDIATEESIPALEQICRLDDDFMEYHFGDVGYEILIPAIARAYSDSPERLAEFAVSPGLYVCVRSMLFEALETIATLHKEKKPLVSDIFKRLILEAADRVRDLNGLDAESAGALLSAALDATIDDEAFEAGRKLFEYDLIDLSILKAEEFDRDKTLEREPQTTHSLRSWLDDALQKSSSL